MLDGRCLMRGVVGTREHKNFQRREYGDLKFIATQLSTPSADLHPTVIGSLGQPTYRVVSPRRRAGLRLSFLASCSSGGQGETTELHDEHRGASCRGGRECWSRRAFHGTVRECGAPGVCTAFSIPTNRSPAVNASGQGAWKATANLRASLAGGIFVAWVCGEIG